MKIKILLYLVVFLAIGIIQSCTTKCDCVDPGILITEYNIKKSIIQTNATNFATGFESVFESTSINKAIVFDSVNAAHLCQSVINPIRFFKDESGYFFIESYNAWMVAHATKPELLGSYRYDIQDVNGKYYVRDMVERIEYKGYGFVDYYFAHPETGLDTKKLSFVKAIPIQHFFIGTGFYDYDENTYYTETEKAFAIVENSTKSMAEGLSGLFEYNGDSISNINYCRTFIDHIRFFDNHSGYFFVYDFNGVNIAHGTQKNLQGENLYNYQDSQGNYVIRDMIEITSTQGFGYYQYYWNNPLTGNEEAKIAFVYKIPGINYFIGSGVYTN